MCLYAAALDVLPASDYNEAAVRTRLWLQVDARRGQSDPRKPAKVRRAWRALEVSPAGQNFSERVSSGEAESL